MAVIASTMTGVRNAIQASCLPATSRVVILPVARFSVCWALAILDVGLKATLNTRGLPLVIPPLTPPAPFFAVTARQPASASAGAQKGSLCSEPLILAAAKPSPNSMPRTAGIENIAWDISDSTESKKGSPRPAGRAPVRHSTTPPTESRSFIAFSMTEAQPSGAFSLATPPTSTSSALISMPAIFLATTPAATTGSVRRPEKCPPPRGSLYPFHLTEAV